MHEADARALIGVMDEFLAEMREIEADVDRRDEFFRGELTVKRPVSVEPFGVAWLEMRMVQSDDVIDIAVDELMKGT